MLEDLVAVVREALTNVARHAHASAVTVDISATATDVTDNGVGIGDTERRSGLDNLCRRAERHGGHFTITSPLPHPEPTDKEGGTNLRWTIPLP